MDQPNAHNQSTFTDTPVASLLGPVPVPEQHPDYKHWVKAMRLAEEELALFDAEYAAKRPNVELLNAWVLDYIPGKFEIQAKWLAKLYVWNYEGADALRPALDWYCDQWLMIALRMCPGLALNVGFRTEMRSRLLSVLTKNRPIALAFARRSEEQKDRDLKMQTRLGKKETAARSVAMKPFTVTAKSDPEADSSEGSLPNYDGVSHVPNDLLPDLQQSVSAALVVERKALLAEYKRVVNVSNKKMRMSQP